MDGVVLDNLHGLGVRTYLISHSFTLGAGHMAFGGPTFHLESMTSPPLSLTSHNWSMMSPFLGFYLMSHLDKTIRVVSYKRTNPNFILRSSQLSFERE
jgi:hypothetical protein